MDGALFDTLIKRLATTRLTRLAALRGLAAGAAGVGLTREEAGAKKNKPKKKPVCVCSSASCQTKKVKDRGKVIRQNAPCAYKGKCTSFNPCATTVPISPPTSPPTSPPAGPPPVPVIICTAGTQTGCTGGRVCNAAGTACIDCSSDDQCGTEFECEAGRCVPALPPD